jgi:hypothetical protein
MSIATYPARSAGLSRLGVVPERSECGSEPDLCDLETRAGRSKIKA